MLRLVPWPAPSPGLSVKENMGTMKQAPRCGIALAAAAVVQAVGWLIAVVLMRGEYSGSFSLTSDVGTPGCADITDAFSPRYVCSPGYGWFFGAQVLCAVLLFGAGVSMARLRARSGRPLAGARAVGFAVAATGGAWLVAALGQFFAVGWLHQVGWAVAMLAVWSACVATALAARRAQIPVGDSVAAAPGLVGRPMVVVATICAVLMAAGMALLVAAALRDVPLAPVGRYEQIFLAAAGVWLVALCAALMSLPRRLGVA